MMGLPMNKTRIPFVGLIAVGVVASLALLVETRLNVSQDVHFLLQFLWVGVVAAALLALGIMVALPGMTDNDAPRHDADEPPSAAPDRPNPATTIPELADSDRAWLQAHPPAAPADTVESSENNEND